MYSKLEVRIHSQVAEAIGNAGKLYYLCRAIDTNGCGKVKLTMEDMIETLKLSKSSIYRYLSNSTLFRSVIRKDNEYTIYYNSVVHVATKNNLESLGGIGFVLVQDLIKYKETVTLLEALALQRQSEYLSKLSNEKSLESSVIFNVLNKEEEQFNLDNLDAILCSEDDEEIESLLEPQNTSYISRGVMIKYDTNSTFIDLDESNVFGGSQDTIAKRLNLSTKTIQRRLNKVSKVRQYIGSLSFKGLYEYNKFIDQEEWTNNASRFFKANYFGKGKMFVPYTNLYEEVIQLTSSKYLRSKLSKSINSSFNELVNIKLAG